jgi:hypothetical protein
VVIESPGARGPARPVGATRALYTTHANVATGARPSIENHGTSHRLAAASR